MKFLTLAAIVEKRDLHRGVGGQRPFEQIFDTSPRQSCILRRANCDGILFDLLGGNAGSNVHAAFW